MARQPMVTRTIQKTVVEAFCLNTITGETTKEQFTLARTYKDEKAVLKQLKKVADTNEKKVVHVISYEAKETLYGMTEQKFIDMAEELPPRPVKENEKEN